MPVKEKLTQIDLNVGDGLQTRLLDNLVRSSQCRSVVNYEFSSYPGMATVRNGALAWASTGGAGTFNLLHKSYVSASGVADYFLAHRGTNLYRALSTGTTFTNVRSGMANAFDDVSNWDDAAYIVNGTDSIRSSNGATWFNIGNRAPNAAPTVAAIAGGSATGTYYGAYSFVYGTFGEGPVSPFSAGVVLANQRIRFSVLSTGVTGVTRRRFYVSSHSAPGTVYRLASDAGAGTTFSTSAFTEDDFLDAAETGLSPFPVCDRIAFHAGRMFGSPVADRGKLVISRAFRPDVYDSLDDINDVRDDGGGRISAIVSLSNEILIVLTETACWALYGSSPATWKLSRIFEVGLPRGAFRTAVVINGRLYWKSRRHVYSTNGYREGTQVLSLPIEATVDTLGLTDANIDAWNAIDYRPKNWYMLFCAAGSNTTGALSIDDHADLSWSPPVGPSEGGVGAWSTNNSAYSGNLCLVYDYLQSSPGKEVWTIFSLGASSSTSVNGRNDTGLAHIATSGAISRFERPSGLGDDSGVINAKIRYAWKSAGDFTRDKRWRRTWLHARMLAASGTVYTGTAKELGNSTFVDSLAYSTVGDVQRLVLPTDMWSEHHSYYFGFSSSSARVVLEGLLEEYKVKGRH